MAKKYKVYITSNAQRDLGQIFSYISEDSVSNSKKFILELEEKIYSLDTLPERFAYIPENIYFETNYRHINHKKYRVVYKIESGSVYIMRVFHGSKLLNL